jgi:hypothetical protein
VYFSGVTAPGKTSGLNEDWTSVTSDLVLVLDGATVRTDTGCIHGVAWYTRKLGAALIAEAASKSHPLEEVLAAAIQEVAKLHPECDLSHPGTPSAAIGMVRLEGESLRYAVLGDVSVVIDVGDELKIISDNRVSQTAQSERAEADKYAIGDAEKDAALVKMKHAELAARNRVDGYWIAAADPSAASHAIVGEVESSKVRRVAVLSDGAARSVDLFGIHDWKSALDTLETRGADALIRQVREAENADPLGQKFRRNKSSDDATAAFAAANRNPSTSAARTRAPISDEDRSKIIASIVNSGPNLPGIMGGQLRSERGDTPTRR